MADSPKDLEVLREFSQSSVYRWKVVMILLPETGKTATRISEEIGTHRSQVSRTLKELREKGLVKCITPSKHKDRLYVLTDEGKRVKDELRAWGGKPPLDFKVARMLDDLTIPYARNVKLKPKARRGTADFVLLDGYEPWMAVAVRSYPEDELKGLKSATFWVSTWSNETENMRTALILGGKPKEKILREGGGFFLMANFLDLVLHEEDLSCIEEKEPSLKEFPSVARECADWPDLEEEEKNG